MSESKSAATTGATEPAKAVAVVDLSPAAARASGQPSLAPAAAGPSLPRGNDAEVAAELGRLVRDANDGVRRIVIAGLFIEQIAAELKHGELETWIATHERVIGCKRATVFNWRAIAADVIEKVGLKKSNALDFSAPLHEILALPASEVPADARDAREKIDALIEGKSMRQLVFEFRAEEQPKKHHPRKTVSLEQKEALLIKEAQAQFRSFRNSVEDMQAEGHHMQRLLLCLPLLSTDPASEVCLVRLGESLKSLVAFVESAISSRK